MDAQAVARFRGGDRSAFLELYECHFPMVYCYLRVLLGSDRQAESVAQSAMLGVFEELLAASISNRPGFRLRLLGKAGREAQASESDRHLVVVAPGASLEDRASAPGTSARRGDEELVRAVGQLPWHQRQVLALRFAVGLEVDQTAIVISRDPAEVRHIERAALLSLGTDQTRCTPPASAPPVRSP